MNRFHKFLLVLFFVGWALLTMPNAQAQSGTNVLTTLSCNGIGVTSVCNASCTNSATFVENRSFYFNGGFIGGSSTWDDVIGFSATLNSNIVASGSGGTASCDQNASGGSGVLPNQNIFTGWQDNDTVAVNLLALNKKNDVNNPTPWGGSTNYVVYAVACGSGQFTQNSVCQWVDGSISANPTSCQEPCSPTITWNMVAGVAARVEYNGSFMSSASSGSVQTSPLLAGSHVFRLFVQDGYGTYYDVGSVTVTVTVRPPLTDPICNPQGNDTTPVNQGIQVSADGGDGPYTWSASPDGSFSPTTGQPVTFTSGTAGTKTITVTSAGRTGTCTVTVNDPPVNPTISLSPTSFTFSATQGGNPANTQTLTLTNSGSLAMGSWTASSNQSWLSLGPTSGSNLATGSSQNIILTVTSSSLAAGTHNATITVSSSSASNSPQTASVTLTVNRPGYPTPYPTPTGGGGNPVSVRLKASTDACGLQPVTVCDAGFDGSGGYSECATTHTEMRMQCSATGNWQNPLNGIAPLTGVDLKFEYDRYGGGPEETRLHIDCTNDGVVDSVSTTLMAGDVCSYPSPGTYTARGTIRGYQSGAIINCFDRPCDALATINVTAPPPPGGFTLQPIGSGSSTSCSGTSSQINLSWTASGGATSYTVYRNGTSYASVGAVTTYTDAAVTAGTSYTYFVRATNGGSTTDSNSQIIAATYCSGSITVNAQLDGNAWTGLVGYSLLGPQNFTGSTVATTHPNLSGGVWTLSFGNGGPAGATLSSITPANPQTLPSNVSSQPTLTFTMNFTSPPPFIFTDALWTIPGTSPRHRADYDYNNDNQLDKADRDLLPGYVAGSGCPAGKTCDINGVNGFTIADIPAYTSYLQTLDIYPNQSDGVATLYLRATGGTVSVSFSSTAPSGTTFAPNPGDVTGSGSTASMTVPRTTASGTYTINVTGTGTGISQQAPLLTLNVLPSVYQVTLKAATDGINWQDLLTGDAPLSGVDLRAQYGIAINGNIYRMDFDCESDGTVEYQLLGSSVPPGETVAWLADICDGRFNSPGTYTAKVDSYRRRRVLFFWRTYLDTTDTATIQVMNVPQSIPAAPSNLQAAIRSNCTQVNLTWTDNASNETGYHIWSTGATTGQSLVYQGRTYHLDVSLPADSQQTNITVLPGTYYYIVTAYNGSGDSTISGQNAVGPIVVNACPAPPSNLQAAIRSNCTQVNLTWTDNASNETGYHLWSTGATTGQSLVYQGRTYHLEASLPADSQQTAVTVLPGTYYYIVTAYNGSGDSTISAQNAVGPIVVNACPPPPPPSGITGDNGSCGQITVTWTDNSSNEDGFRVYRSKNNQEGSNNLNQYDLISSPPNHVPPVSGTGGTGRFGPQATPPLVAGNFYSFAVMAYNAGGDSAPAFSPIVQNIACTPNLSLSSIVVDKVNGVAFANQQIKNNDLVKFRIVMDNRGNSTAYDLSIDNTLSSNLSYQPATAACPNCANSPLPERISNQTITWPNRPPDSNNLGDQSAGGSNWLLTFDVRVVSNSTQPVDFIRVNGTITYALSNGGPQNQSVNYDSRLILVRTGQAKIPDIKEVAP